MSVGILLVDDHQMFREGLRAILERDANLKVVGEASDGRQAIERAVAPPAPDLVIMDIGMPGLNGVDATRQILVVNPKARVIALSGHSDRRFIAAMLEAGASAYVLKESASDEILRAVQAVHRGQKFISSCIAGSVIERYLGQDKPEAPAASHGLSPREREVVQLLSEGKTSKDVASLLHLSPKTVETHRRNIMAKLKLGSIAALTKFAIREGLTSTDN